VGATVFGLLGATCLGSSRAGAVETALLGAWLQDITPCEEVFNRKGKTASFKKPINVFAPAFIISGNQVRTPQASCLIKSVKPIGERRVLTLACATPVAVDEATAILAPSSDGSLRRYLHQHDTEGSVYKRCTS
jgi:hypothetical protein